MRLKVFGIKDNATQAFNKPFFMLTKAEAIRAFTVEANSQDSQIGQHPHDFHLYYIGNYDQDTSLFTQDDGVVDLGSAASYKDKDSGTNNIEMFPSREVEKS